MNHKKEPNDKDFIQQLEMRINYLEQLLTESNIPFNRIKHPDVKTTMSNQDKLSICKEYFIKLSLSSGNPGIMYLHNISDELQDFRDSFCHYLPIYVKNEDTIETMDFSDDINSKHELYSKRIWRESKVFRFSINTNRFF